MSKVPIDEYFKYHPPTTGQRKLNHDLVNHTALEFARLVDTIILDEDCKKMALFSIQQARMFANQGITVDEIKRNLNQE